MERFSLARIPRIPLVGYLLLCCTAFVQLLLVQSFHVQSPGITTPLSRRRIEQPATLARTHHGCSRLWLLLGNYQEENDDEKLYEIPILLPFLSSVQQQGGGGKLMPLPCSHLTDELATLNIYPLGLQAPVHKIAIRESANQQQFGHICFSNNNNSTNTVAVGSIGCASRVLEETPLLSRDDTETTKWEDQSMVIPCKSLFRFVVKKVVREIPFPVVLVKELPDELPAAPTASSQRKVEIANQGDDEDDDDDLYGNLTTEQLIQRIFNAMNEYCEQQLKEGETTSLLEQSILQDLNVPLDVKRNLAEEKAAVWQVFVMTVDDLYPSPVDRYYAIGMLVATLTELSYEQRCTILQMTDGVQRLRHVLRHVEEMNQLAKARQVAQQITDRTDEASKDLKVGEPELPPWAKSIRKNMQVEYYWNEEYGWCRGRVIADPLRIVDEILLQIEFEDGETHVLPFSAHEKVRWRPPQ